MNRNFGILTLLVAILMATTIGCERMAEQMMPPMSGGDEESANQLTLDETYENIRNGALLIMAYDPASKSFKGTVENTTDAILPQVRVEIHLFDSKTGNSTAELGPTPPKDLAPGEIQNIVLPEEGPPFDRWTAHPEVGPSSGGSGGEGGNETGGEHGAGGDEEPPMSGGDEESANQLTLDEFYIYDNVQNVHVDLLYDASRNTFWGSVENISDAVVQQVRVEIHLFDSKTGNSTAELGPTPPKDLAPGERLDIVLMAEGPAFDRWTAHVEFGPSSGGSGGEGGNEAGGEHGAGGEGGGN